MSKILLVEDDNNLREIYEARLQAEGYEIVSARDGEEALTVAMKEKPDLIISDVMMPKISGFDMLDIIRSTEETKNSKVIMMTALSQAEDKERATKLGADRYLVKSQVTLEDVAKVAREVLEGKEDKPSAPQTGATDAATSMTPEPVAVSTPPVEPAPVEESAPTPAPLMEQPAVAPTPDPTPVAPAPEPVATPTPLPGDDSAPGAATTSDDDSPAAAQATQTVEDVGQSTTEEKDAIAAQIENFIDAKKAPTEPAASAEPEQPAEDNSGQPKKKVIQPINDLSQSGSPGLEALMKKEEEKEQMAEIAKEISSSSGANDTAAELSAEAALRSAARSPSTPTPEQPAVPSGVAEVKIDESGAMQSSVAPAAEPANVAHPAETPTPVVAENPAAVANPPLQAQMPQPLQLETPSPAPVTPAVPTAPPEVPAEPNIPHSNGSSIDGVSPPVQKPQSGPDPSSIAL